MNIADAIARIRAHTNSTMPMEDLRALAREFTGKKGPEAVPVFLEAVHFWRIAEENGGSVQPTTQFLARVRRDYTGPFRLDGVPLGDGLSVVTVEDGPRKLYIAESAAVPTVIWWLSERMKG